TAKSGATRRSVAIGRGQARRGRLCPGTRSLPQRAVERALPRNLTQLACFSAVIGWKTGQAPISQSAHAADNEVPSGTGLAVDLLVEAAWAWPPWFVSRGGSPPPAARGIFCSLDLQSICACPARQNPPELHQRASASREGSRWREGSFVAGGRNSRAVWPPLCRHTLAYGFCFSPVQSKGLRGRRAPADRPCAGPLPDLWRCARGVGPDVSASAGRRHAILRVGSRQADSPGAGAVGH